MVKLPEGSAEYKIACGDYDQAPPGMYEVVIVDAKLREIPEHVRVDYNIKQTHSVNIRASICDKGQYYKTTIWDTLYPVVDQFGLPTGKFGGALESMGVDITKEFDTESLLGLHCVFQTDKKLNSTKVKVVQRYISETHVNKLTLEALEGTMAIFSEDLQDL